MTQTPEARAKLAKLADAFMQDILATPDADIVVEVGKDGIEWARAQLLKAKQELSSRLLIKAKKELEDWKLSESKQPVFFNRSAARSQFDKIRAGDMEFDRKMTMAARNGQAPTDTDVDGLADDWADLQRLDGEDEPK